jgi:capsular polysaccharide transport system permease protein
MQKLRPLKNALVRVLPGRLASGAPRAERAPVERAIFQGIGASDQGLKSARERLRYQARITLFLFVILPVLLSAIYYAAFATSQYQVETRFGIRSGEGHGGGALSGLPSAAGSNDAYIIIDFLRSPDLVRAVDTQFGLTKVYHEKADLISRLDSSAPLEHKVEYWRDMVRPRVDSPSQSVVVAVRAFTPEDSLAIAQFLITRSERLVNELSKKSREEALASARAEVAAAEDRLRRDREAIKEYRDSSKILDPRSSVASRQELSGRIQAEIASLNAEMRALRSYLADNAPAIISLRNRIASLEAELTKIRSDTEVSSKDGKLSNVIQSFENLQTDTVFAEKAYIAALASLDRARIEADRKIKYLAVHVQPTTPEISTYPKRFTSVLTVLVVCFMLWGTGWLIVLGIRDHMH